MQKVHKLLEEHRPTKLKTMNLMFEQIKNRAIGSDKIKQFDTPQSNAHPSTKLVGSSSKTTGIQDINQTHKRTQSKEMPRRLKLKDYMRLNEISKQKRSRSTDSLKLKSNQKITVPIAEYHFDPRNTFGMDACIPSINIRSQEKPIKKATKSYEQQIQLESFQLMNTLQKVKQKFNKMVILIEQTIDKFTNYTDLVFMFRIEETLNESMMKGIQSISNSYNEHFVENHHEGIDKEMKELMEMRISTIIPSKKDLSLSKSPAMRAEEKTIQEERSRDKPKYKNFNFLPVTVQSYNSFGSKLKLSNVSGSMDNSKVYVDLFDEFQK